MVKNDTVYGSGYVQFLNNDFKRFEGEIALADAEKIETLNMFSKTDSVMNVVFTRDKEYNFKLTDISYEVKDDTIYGKGESRYRSDKNEFNGKIGINDSAEIQVSKFDSPATILTIAFIVSFVAILISSTFCIYCD